MNLLLRTCRINWMSMTEHRRLSQSQVPKNVEPGEEHPYV